MRKAISRRRFLQTGAAGGAGAILSWPAFVKGTPVYRGPMGNGGAAGACVTICNHWSYIGIGWQLGLESCVLSVTDAIEMADRPPHAKTCQNLDARAYEFMAEKFPEVTERLKGHLASGKVELIGGTYGQPMGTTISGESNVRQIVLGRDAIRRALGYEMVTFLEEEEFTHPQIPQLAVLAGFRYASLAQLDTWGRAGCPRTDLNVLNWKGMDGTVIPCVPKNALFGYAPDLKKLAASEDFRKLQALGKPLIFTWEEFGWESPEEPAYLTAPARYGALADVEFVTIKEYLDKYGTEIKDTVYFPMDAWNKSLTWGLGGDQVRILDRKVDALLLAAELFDAAASAHGHASQAQALDAAWRDLLASQSHDVGLCEYSRWQGDRMAPFDRIEDKHNFTWGAIGYDHLDAARKQGEAVLGSALEFLGGRINTREGLRGDRAALVFNPHAWPRTGLVETGRLYPLPQGTRGIVVRDRSGRAVPSQIVKSAADAAGNLVEAEAAFLAADVPSTGYGTYDLGFASEAVPSADAGLRVDESSLSMENGLVRVGLDRATGGISRLTQLPTEAEMLETKSPAFPRFSGRPTSSLSTRPDPPAAYDSSSSQAQIDWIAKGPLFATLRARQSWKYLKFETRVTLAAARPYVEVTTRLLAFIPPQADASPPDIKEGYWLSLVPGFPVERVLRDFPFGVEETKNPAFHALTFADLLGRDRGLLVLHAGTQYFRREPGGGVSNLVMREWESYYSKEFGWPIYAEYRHGLMPHGAGLDNSGRHRAAAAFARPLIFRAAPPHKGDLPRAASFLGIRGEGIAISSFRRKPAGGYELRLVETEGRPSRAAVEIRLPVRRAAVTDLLGNKLAEAALLSGRLEVETAPWKILTFHLE